MIRLQEVIDENDVGLLEHSGIQIASVKNKDQGLSLAKKILYESVDKDTVLFLSGGLTPKPLYQELSREKRLNPGAVAMVDERYGESFHPNSNGEMIKDTGLISYFKNHMIPFNEILRLHLEGVRLKLEYNKTVKQLLSKFSKKIAIMGIGEDGHTAGITSNRENFKNPLFNKNRKDLLVDSFRDYKSMDDGGFGERITLTFKALSKMDLLLVLVFGKNKKSALTNMFKEGSIEEIPARFYKKPNIAKKTIFITDQTM